ncbi:hypothetical protein SERLA73DRAFT_138831 [Serpula lacrymans var. lacrymans S7.3]|uniref:Protein-S-isoprenylcysteine O-methyltransferase n=2 Tax=Serpula lacrymans var. lacrymans TaxID=341189 RepID=F8PZT6_SERL3|nr:uncharacterized protein SERLADRAFT_392646 [Serpula lacrymans var. lacrymans S7.9]EGN98408.1 hypothetical protein SERLA73DRAFT_138831 [Serpula lacrymans var. lacrymans S7.3]EGO23961.1 hypothetical protein SERLADRAFT_392646 [Serpula lacrymans var. lacrymans S7.9]
MIDLTNPSPRAIESLMFATILAGFVVSFRQQGAMASQAKSEGGAIRPQSLPATFIGKVVTPIHGAALFVPIAVYIVTLVVNGLRQPEWMMRLALPDYQLEESYKVVLRITACVLSLAAWHFIGTVGQRHLGSQWHYIGRRENSKVVQTGPYAIVRHPMYGLVLLQEALFAVITWSYVPIFSLMVIAGAFAIKMPIEEGFIEADAKTAKEYQEYKRKVTARVVPYVW